MNKIVENKYFIRYSYITGEKFKSEKESFGIVSLDPTDLDGEIICDLLGGKVNRDVKDIKLMTRL